ncbi:Acyl-CoA synthetase (AMP-forming)/AMP-acid ligase II [Thalassovita litoralis]|uniref:Acyl-CoA synthetase (AMP-forming)/AMP-acid ligase II n=1 Tax=Thalassovita litoralis TaxID=1010611 RepID=A0A521FQY9_9RHOB|nr:AMP-binding protein [Thalassovita litoralis]SMO98613.1 Acyl-CoA synthetase (AMP-forming)/AMP-acid ligase II [Thalassovita litoralis]
MDWDRFLQQLAARGDTPALIEADGTTVSAAAFAEQAQEVAQQARALGLSGRRVGIVMQDSLSAASLILGLTQVASVLPLNPALTPAELRDILRAAGAGLVLCDAPHRALAAQLSLPVIVLGGAMPVAPDLPGTPRFAPGLVLTTSGSTGTPKRVPLRADQLLRSAHHIAQALALGPEDRAVSALPVFHVGALVDLLLAPLLAGGSVCASADKSPTALHDAVIQRGGTWVQLVPTMLSRCLLDLTPDQARHMGQRLGFIRMVSADLSPDLQARAEAFFANTPLIQMYGMTETAGQIATNPRPPGQRVPGSVGCAAGADIAILDPQGQPAPEGEVCVRGPCVTEGYEGSETPRYGEWLRTGDLGRMDAQGYLFLTGRLKEIINRGGEKISPLTVERAALRLPGVAEAVAFAVPHKTLGEQVGLAVSGAGLSEAAVLAHLAGELAEFERPRQVRIVAQMPRLGSGKVDRRALAAGDIASPTAAAHLSGTAQTVARVWAKVLGTDTPAPDRDFFDDGGDSLSATEFLLALERALSRDLPPNLLFEAPRFGDLVARIDAAPQPRKKRRSAAERYVMAATSAWPGERAGPSGLLILRNGDAPGVPVFFGVNDRKMTDELEQTLGQGRPIYFLRSLLGGGMAKIRGEARIAQLIAQDIQHLRPSGRLILGGFCEGAGIMQRVAELLRQAGRGADLFIAVDWEIPYHTPSPLVLIWTNARWFSPFSRFDRPGRFLHDAYPHGAVMHHIAADHEHALEPDKFGPVADMIRRYLDGETPPRFPKREDIDQPARQARWKAHIRLIGRMPRILRTGQVVALPIRVRNDSGVIWPPHDISGIGASGVFIGPRLLRRGPFYPWYRRVFGPRPPIQRMQGAVEPGESRDLTLRLLVPHKPGLYLLRVSMLEDGFAYFMKGWRVGRFRLVWVRRNTR